MHIPASGNFLTDGHTIANRQIPAPEALYDKLGYLQGRSTNVGEKSVPIFPPAVVGRGCGWLTVLVKTQGQSGPSSVSFVILFIGHCCEKYRLPSSQTLTSIPSPAALHVVQKDLERLYVLNSEGTLQWAGKSRLYSCLCTDVPVHMGILCPLYSPLTFGLYNFIVAFSIRRCFPLDYVLHDMKWSV